MRGLAGSTSGCGWACTPVRRRRRPRAWWAWRCTGPPGWRRSDTGGRCWLSETAAALVRDALPPGASLTDLGVHRLKDLGRPERIFQLQAAGLQAGFPPLRSLGNPALPNNLPAQLATFIGRDRELAEVRALVESCRLVTLTGAGGCGKTRLGLQVAAELLDGSGDGVWLVELAAVSDEDAVAAAICRGAGDRRPAGPARPGRPCSMPWPRRTC